MSEFSNVFLVCMGAQVAQLYPIFKEKLSVFLTCKNTFINVRSSFLSFFSYVSVKKCLYNMSSCLLLLF